jgi:hypothetical protein
MNGLRANSASPELLGTTSCYFFPRKYINHMYVVSLFGTTDTKF